MSDDQEISRAFDVDGRSKGNRDDFKLLEALDGGTPLHYSEVFDRFGISPWAAKGLVKKGVLRRNGNGDFELGSKGRLALERKEQAERLVDLLAKLRDSLED